MLMLKGNCFSHLHLHLHLFTWLSFCAERMLIMVSCWKAVVFGASIYRSIYLLAYKYVCTDRNRWSPNQQAHLEGTPTSTWAAIFWSASGCGRISEAFVSVRCLSDQRGPGRFVRILDRLGDVKVSDDVKPSLVPGVDCVLGDKVDMGYVPK